MTSKNVVRLLLLFFLLATGLPISAAIAQRRPNLVIIFVDDMGYADLGSFGAKDYLTPRLDRMAKEGIRLTDFYAAQAVCTASRAALLTGCYPNRVSLTGALFPIAKIGLNPDEMTIAEIIKTPGYATGVLGKWHLGHLPLLD
jgi:arylsulfatase A